MIDLDDLERNLNWYEARIKNPEPGVIYHLDYSERGAIRELIGRLREAEADAKRYRWMRDKGLLGEVGDAMDSALDVAMQSETDATR